MTAGVPYFGLLVLSVALAAGAQLLWKKGAEISAASNPVNMFVSPYILGGLMIYGFSAAAYIISLRKIPLAVAYPSIALGYVLVVVASWLWFGEALGWSRILALLMICGGVALLWVGS